MKLRTILLAVLSSALICVQATADITIPWDTNPYGTYAEWTLTEAPTDFTDIAPDGGWKNPWGEPSAGLFVEGDLASGPTWNVGGTVFATPIMRIELEIDNAPGIDLTKVVQVELQYHVQTGPESGYMNSFLVPWGTTNEYTPVRYTEDWVMDTAEGAWYDLTLEFSFPQLYDGESISIWLHDSGVTLDSIEVATVCVPVPAAVLIGMLGLGVAGLKLRKYV